MVSSADYGNIRFDIILIIFIQEYREGRGIDLASAVMCINILSDCFRELSDELLMNPARRRHHVHLPINQLLPLTIRQGVDIICRAGPFLR